MEAVDEGCDVESASAHMSIDLGHFLPDIRNPLADRLDRPGGAPAGASNSSAAFRVHPLSRWFT